MATPLSQDSRFTN